MKKRNQKGFSLVELIIVVVIIGIIAAIAVPNLQKAMVWAEVGSAVSLMRTMHSAQISYYTSQNRYARMDELNVEQRSVLGITIDNSNIVRKNFTYTLSPVNATDADLKNNFLIIATRATPNPMDLPYTITIDQAGHLDAIFLDQ